LLILKGIGWGGKGIPRETPGPVPAA